MRKHLLLFALLIISLTASSQQYTFIEYSLKEGLQQSQVRSLFQDSKGFIWVGTLGGISRFDGREFTNYNRSNGLLNNQISAIIELSDGSIMVGSSGSVSILRGGKVESFKFEKNFKESAVNTLYQQGSKVWIGTEDGILFFENNKINYPIDKGEPFGSNVKAFVSYHERSFFIVTKEKIFLSQNGGIQLFHEPNDRSVNYFDLELTSKGEILLATKGQGLVRLKKNGEEELLFASTGLDTETLTGITEDIYGRIWCSSRFGFYMIEEDKIQFFSEKNGLNTPDIRDILCDYEGNIWLGTYGHGLQKFTGTAFFAYAATDGLTSDAIMSITQDNQGQFWFSTFDKGICHTIGDTIIGHIFDESTGNNRIWSSLTDKNGTLWFGSSFGLFSYKNGKFKNYAEEDSLLDPMVISLFEDSKGRLLIGTAKGLCVLENEVFRSFKQFPGNPDTRIRDIQEDRSGNLWLASRIGLYKFDGSSFTKFDETSGLPDNTVYTVEIDEYNRVWVGTQNGIAILSGDRFISSTIDQGGASNSINFLKYFNGSMWFGTNNGLYSTEVGENLRENELRIRRYGMEDGLRSLETNLNAVYVDKQKRLWFGTTEGVMCLEPSLLREHEQRALPKVALTDVQIDFLNPDWNKFKAIINQVTGLPVHPSVDYKSNHFTFKFTGVSMSYPDDVKYQFMLEGFDEDWQAVTEANFITYSNLPYNTFRFKVRAVSRFGVMGEPVVFEFTVRPPFWLTWWFVLLEVLLGAALILGIWYVRRRVVRARFERERLEMRSRMLTLEQQSLNSSMNRHFIFNALNSIQYYINRQDRLAANKYLSDFARLIRKNLDSSQETLTPLRDEMERLELYLKLEHMRFKDKFEYSISIAPDIPQDLIKVPAMLLQPFLENSIWHGLLPKKEAGWVKVRLLRRDNSLHMEIEDNGVGIENSLKSKTGTDSHISKGMEITQSRIDLIQKMSGEKVQLIGPYQVNGDQGEVMGTKVEIIIPVNFSELFSQ